MAEIYQIPENSGSKQGAWGLPFSIPIGNGGLFGNGGGSLADLFGLAIVASMFGWNGYNGFGMANGGFGMANGAGYIASQLNNDSGRELIMNAITSQGEMQSTAIQTLATTIGQSFGTVNNAVSNLQNMISTIASNQGMNALQVINAIERGDAGIISQFQQCCCENKMAIERLSGTIQSTSNANTQLVLSKLSEMQTQNLQDKLDASRAENTRLAGEISQANQNNAIAVMIANAINPIVNQLSLIRSEVDCIKRCQPSTVTLPNNSMTAVPTVLANAVAGNIVDRIAVALTPAAAGGGAAA